jgi:predicted Rossmann fold flavoprotein
LDKGKIMSTPCKIVVVGGGAAGFFGAISAAQAHPDCNVILLEKARQVLSKVRISGGGRCNVTHSCFEPSLLVQNYPRGNKVLRGPFSRFQPKDTVRWFESRGVELKTEPDGRMFPVTDSSETIIRCLISEAKASGVQIRTECGLNAITRDHEGFALQLHNGENLSCNFLLIATGSNAKAFEWLQGFGHKIEPTVPSLFTFNIPRSPLEELAGISIPKVHVKISETSLEQTGPLLITHWGFSGPAVLKLSAWGARTLHEKNYQAQLHINWLPDYKPEILRQQLLSYKSSHPIRFVNTDSPFDIPKNLWKKICIKAEISAEIRWSAFSNKHLQTLIEQIHNCSFRIDGKSTYKEEFVTCGGVSLDEVNFKTMESKLCPRLYLAGEVLDIDGVTGGFNFQNAWTTGWIAGQSMM